MMVHLLHVYVFQDRNKKIKIRIAPKLILELFRFNVAEGEFYMYVANKNSVTTTVSG